jgi:hypothetical protein
MNENTNTQNVAAAGMPSAIYQDMTPEDRLAKIKETADQVVNHNYKRPYSEDEVTEIRRRISDLCVKISDLERELASVKAQYKAEITPLEASREDLIGDLRSGGDYVDEECYVFMNFEIGKAGLYNGDGILLNEKDITPEMSQSTIFQALRDNLLPDDQYNEEKLLLEAPEE